jgi:inorganic pyrophosphatase
LDEIFAHVRREIEHFFTIYKELEGRATSTLGWKGAEAQLSHCRKPTGLYEVHAC